MVLVDVSSDALPVDLRFCVDDFGGILKNEVYKVYQLQDSCEMALNNDSAR